jgi:hypothetical protein
MIDGCSVREGCQCLRVVDVVIDLLFEKLGDLRENYAMWQE